MRLLDLDPHWLTFEGRRVGFIFRCPTKPECWQSCFYEAPPRREQWALFGAALNADPDDIEMMAPDVQGSKEGTRWAISGEFENLTVTPSIDGSAGGNWHGFVTNGQIVGGL